MTIRRTRATLLRAASPVAFAALLPATAIAQDAAFCDAIAASSLNGDALGGTLADIADPSAALLACAPTYDAATLEAVIAAYEQDGDPTTADELRALLADLTDSDADPEELAATTDSVEEIVDPENEAGEGASAADATAVEGAEPKTITVDEDGEATAEVGIDAVGADTESAEAPADGPAEPAAEAATDTTVVTETPAETPAEAPADATVTADAATDAETQALADALAAGDTETEAEVTAEAGATDDSNVAEEIATEGAEDVAGAMETTEGTTETATETATDTGAAAEAAPMDAEVTAAVDAAGGDVAQGIEAPQQDTEASAEAANAAPTASAAAAAATEAETTDATASAETEVETETVTAESAPSATRERDDDDETFRNALLLGLGAVAVGTILANQGQVVQETGDRVVVRRDSGDLVVLKNDDALLRQPGAQIQTRTYDDGSTLTTVTREDGSRVVTVRAANGQVLRRSVILADGTETVLFDDTQEVAPVEVAELDASATANRDIEVLTLEEALAADVNVDRRYSLQQIRQIRAVRYLAPELNLSDVNFETGSAVIRPEEAEDLRDIGVAMRDAILNNPGEVFLIEGHTDAVGGAAMNLALSDRRAEAVALALTEFFGVPPENMIVQGYGESNLKVVTGGSERANRRAAVRRITPLLNGEA